MRNDLLALAAVAVGIVAPLVGLRWRALALAGFALVLSAGVAYAVKLPSVAASLLQASYHALLATVVAALVARILLSRRTRNGAP